MAFNVLIVDNQRDVSKAIRAGVQSLGNEFTVASALSGEEALLEARLKKFDLLISEVRLTGMSGIELMRKLRAAKPDLKVILLSSSADRYIRREVADSGAEVFLQKPIETSTILSQIELVLGLGENKPAVIQEEVLNESEPGSISDKLSELRQKLKASLCVLLSDTGENLVQAGDSHEVELDSATSSLLAAFSAGHRIARLLGAGIPKNLYIFNGNKHDFILSDVGESHSLLMVTPPSFVFENIAQFNLTLQQGIQDLLAILADMGVAPLTPEEQVPVEQTDIPALEEEDELFLEMDADLEALFQDKGNLLETTDFDSFWEPSVVGDTGIFTSADALTYDQARQLGLAPSEE